MIEGSISVGLPKDAKIDDAVIQKIAEDTIKSVSESENVIINEDHIMIEITRY
jgi:hypothetical protein